MVSGGLSLHTGLHYQPGDVLHVLPRQPANAVHAVLRHCGWAWNDHVCIRNTETGASFEAAVGPLVAGVVDISAASPRRFWFEVLSHMARAPHEAERLQYFSSAEGRDDLYNYNQREGAVVCMAINSNTPTRHALICVCVYMLGVHNDMDFYRCINRPYTVGSVDR